MDAHAFRRVAGALLAKLAGARLEKIHALAHDTTQWSFYGHGEKFTLVLRAHRKSPFLFTTARRVPVGMEPPAFVMRFRKYLAGHRITAVYSEWIARRLWLRFMAGPEHDGVWLCLDLREGPILHFEPPQALTEGAVLPWPDLQTLAETESVGWRQWPVLTPALRRTLTALPVEEGAALLVDLETGEGDVFVYRGLGVCELSAWPLPEPMRQGREETVYEDALAAATLVGEEAALPMLARDAAVLAARPHEREAARLERLLAKLEGEESRLRLMAAAQADAMLLQAELYRFGRDEKQARVTLQGADGLRELDLDPKLTVRENMAALFHKAGRGRRGLAMLAGRRESVSLELAGARERARLAAGLANPIPGKVSPARKGYAGPQRGATSPKTGAGNGASNNTVSGTLPKGVQAFTSSDGLLMLRGRDAKGNLAALKLARPDDMWVHVEGTAGAHVIIRKNAGQPIPETTLHEAGVLAALKSPYNEAGTAAIQYAFARYVQPMRGKKPGMVRIDRHEPGLVVRVNKDLETSLAGLARG